MTNIDYKKGYYISNGMDNGIRIILVRLCSDRVVTNELREQDNWRKTLKPSESVYVQIYLQYTETKRLLAWKTNRPVYNSVSSVNREY